MLDFSLKGSWNTGSGLPFPDPTGTPTHSFRCRNCLAASHVYKQKYYIPAQLTSVKTEKKHEIKCDYVAYITKW